MNLLDASLCLDCEEIYTRRDFNTGCPVCSSKYSVPLVRYIKPIQGVKKEEKSVTKLK
jgi:hypothetical protein